jgi:hypothetical protein
MIPALIGLLIFAAVVAGFWKVFTKAGKPGWAAIVPIYNIIVLLDIAGKPVWWIVFYLLAFIPIVGGIAALVVGIMVGISVARRFGKSDGFGVGLGLLSPIFYPILGFGDAKFIGGGPAAPVATATPPQPPAA